MNARSPRIRQYQQEISLAVSRGTLGLARFQFAPRGGRDRRVSWPEWGGQNYRDQHRRWTGTCNQWIRNVAGKEFGEVSARRRVGFLPESPAYYHRNARATLKMCGALNGLREPELSRCASQLLAAVGLDDEAERNVGKFSRGMLQRVGVAQAFINDPDLLILDEPTSALDPISRLHIRQLLLDARNRGKSVFLSSHQLSEIELICDRIFFVQAGRVVAAGSTGELLRSSEACEITVSNTKGLPASAVDIQRQADQTTFTIPVSEQRAAIEQIWAAGGTLISVARKTKSLEEVFIDVMNGNSGERTP